MTAETKRTLKDTGATLGLITVAAAGVLLVTHVVLSPPVLRLAWNDSNPTNTIGLTAEFWASTNLLDWYHKTNVPVRYGSNYIAFPADKPREFFKVRNRRITNGVTNYSDWSRK